MIQLTRAPIDAAALLDRVTTPAAGAVVLFLGTVREFTAGRQTTALDYECYPEMAEKQLGELEAEARRRWTLVDVAMVHRLGRLELAEASVAVAVSSPHRDAAFEAGRWLIDTLKQVVPIWKQENWADGTTEWVHPGLESAERGARSAEQQTPGSTSLHAPRSALRDFSAGGEP
jgi:molybdopterin synthase catalytic subunit